MVSMGSLSAMATQLVASRNGRGGSGMSRIGGKVPEKAYILNEETKDKVECLFNPTEYTVSKSNSWNPTNKPGTDVPQLMYGGGNPAELQMELFFDTYEKGEDVTKYTKKLMAMARIEPKTVDQQSNLGRPPVVLFSWGEFFSFRAVITSLSIRYTLFLSNGIPVRAVASVSFQECAQADLPQQEAASPSPTRGTRGHKVRVVRPGDTIDRIAFEEYGDSKAWRHLAQANNLDNPLDLRPGQALMVLPRTT